MCRQVGQRCFVCDSATVCQVRVWLCVRVQRCQRVSVTCLGVAARCLGLGVAGSVYLLHTLLCCAVLCCAVLCCVVLCSVLLCSVVLSCALLPTVGVEPTAERLGAELPGARVRGARYGTTSDRVWESVLPTQRPSASLSGLASRRLSVGLACVWRSSPAAGQGRQGGSPPSACGHSAASGPLSARLRLASYCLPGTRGLRNPFLDHPPGRVSALSPIRSLWACVASLCGVWRVACGVWCVACGVRCVVCGVWCVCTLARLWCVAAACGGCLCGWLGVTWVWVGCVSLGCGWDCLPGWQFEWK